MTPEEIEVLRKEVESIKGYEIEYVFVEDINGRDDTCAAFVAAADLDIGITIHGFFSDEQREAFDIPDDADDWPVDCIGRGEKYKREGTYDDEYLTDIQNYVKSIKAGVLRADITKENCNFGAQTMSDNCPFS